MIFKPVSFAAAAVAACLLAAGCSSGSDTDAAAVPVTATTATTTSQPVPVPTTTTLPEVPDELEELPVGVIVPTRPETTTTAAGGQSVPTLPPRATTTTEPPPAGFEFITQGTSGARFYVKLEPQHPLAVCLSQVDGNPALSGLQADNTQTAREELAAIGAGCLGNPQLVPATADPQAALISCLDEDGDATQVCVPPPPATATTVAPIPQLPTTTTAPPVPQIPTTTTTTTTAPPTTTTLPALTPREVLETVRGELFTVRTNPYARKTSEENETNIEIIHYANVNQIMNFARGRSVARSEPIIYVHPFTDEWVEKIRIYEDQLRDFSLFNLYNTCGAERFPQITPQSSMFDFMHPPDMPLTPPPADRDIEWLLRRAAQAKHDSNQLNRHATEAQHPQMLLCLPIISAYEGNIPPLANWIWQPHDGRKANLTPRPEGYEYHIKGISQDRSAVLVAYCYTGSDASEYQRGFPHGLSVLIWEDGHYKELDGVGSIDGRHFTGCEEAFTVAGHDDYAINTFLVERNPVLAGKSYELFPFGQRIYTADDLLTFPN